MKRLIPSITLALFAFTACTEKQDFPSMTINPTGTLEFEASGSATQYVDVTCNQVWAIDSAATWMKVTVGGNDIVGQEMEPGSKPVKVEIAVLDNDGFPRSFKLYFNGGTRAKKSIIVNQKGTKEAIEEGDGTKEHPFCASQARTEALKLADKAVSDKEYYIRGIIHKLVAPKDNEYNPDSTLKYGNLNFYISDDGASSKDKDFYCYRTFGLDGANFTYPNELKVGDDVVVCGKITNYGGTPETSDKPYLVSLNGQGSSDTPAEELTIDRIIEKTTGKVKTTGKIMHIGKDGAILNDGTDNNLYVYTTVPANFKKGDVVDVEGNAKLYNGVVEIEKATYTASTNTVNAKENPAKTLTTEQMASYSNPSSELVSFSGVLEINGNYINVALDGSTTLFGSVNTTEDVAEFSGRTVNVTGYYAGISTSGEKKYFNVVCTDIQGDGSDYFTLSAETLDVAATQTSATFVVNTNLDWTAASDNADFTVNPDSGNGKDTVTVSFTANTDIDAVKTATITVTTTLGSKTVTITQAKAADPNAKKVYLTNEEIVAGVKTGSGYTAFKITSLSGEWNVVANAAQKYLQIRPQKKGDDGLPSYAKSPVFSGNVEKIDIVLDAKNGTTAGRMLYALPVDTEIKYKDPDSSGNCNYTDDTYTNAYGSVDATGVADTQKTVTINFNADTNQFMLLAKGGARYIYSITVYIK